LQTAPIQHFVPNPTVNKYELLQLFDKSFGRSHKILNVDNIGPPVDRSIATKFNKLGELYGTSSFEKAFEDLKPYLG
jgi:hypothetical protein